MIPGIYQVLLKHAGLCLSFCHHGLATQSVSFQPRVATLVREGEWLSQRNTGSRAAPSRVRSVLSVADNPEAVGFTLQTSARICMIAHCPIPFLPTGRIHARGGWLFSSRSVWRGEYPLFEP